MARGTQMVYVTGIRPEGVVVSELRAAEKAGREAALAHWYGRYLAHHYTPGGFKKYGYQMRVLGYKGGTEEHGTGYVNQSVRYKYHHGIVLKEESMGESLGDSARRIKDPAARKKRLDWLEGRNMAHNMRYRLMGMPFHPLHRTGATEAMTRAGFTFKERGLRRTHLVMRVPRYMYMQRRPEDVDKVSEQIRITRPEALDMTGVMASTMRARMVTRPFGVGRAA